LHGNYVEFLNVINKHVCTQYIRMMSQFLILGNITSFAAFLFRYIIL